MKVYFGFSLPFSKMQEERNELKKELLRIKEPELGNLQHSKSTHVVKK